MVTVVARWKIDHDPKATAHCYSALRMGSGCDCSDCRNFLAAIYQAFPPSFRSIADSLGIDIQKPAELAHYGREELGKHLTGGWFHIVGHIISGSDCNRPVSPDHVVFDLARIEGDMEIGFTEHLDLVADSFKSYDLVQLEFITKVPWVISDPESH